MKSLRLLSFVVLLSLAGSTLAQKSDVFSDHTALIGLSKGKEEGNAWVNQEALASGTIGQVVFSTY